jgi:hypothetical protein
MSECNWIVLGLLSTTAATLAAAATALFLGLYPRQVERRERRDHAAFLRAQLLSHLEAVQASLGASDQPLSSEQQATLARLHYLGLHADLLRPEEWRGLIELQSMLQRVDHKRSINKREVRALDRALVDTCALLKAHGESGRSRAAGPKALWQEQGFHPSRRSGSPPMKRFMRKIPLPWGDRV